MVNKILPEIVLVGAGNVGTQLGKRLHKRKQSITQVFSRTEKKAKRLAARLESNWTTDLSRVQPNADLYILAVHDDCLSEVAAGLAKTIEKDSLVVHTSGATPSTIIEPYFRRYGVFYPLQTLSVKRKPKWSKIPICLFANQDGDLEFLKQIAHRISKNIHVLNDNDRAAVHVAAVFANNFPNYLFAIAHDILKQQNLSFDLIRPLIMETAEKVSEAHPRQMQTGPASRGDVETIERHLKSLKQHEDWKAVYQLLTNQISAGKQ